MIMYTSTFMYNLLSLNLSWFYHQIVDSFAIVVLMFFVCYFFVDRNLKLTFLVWAAFFINCWTLTDFTVGLGWVFYTGSFIFVLYISRFLVLVFAEASEKLKNKLPLLTTIQFLALLVIWNLLGLG